VDQQILHVFRSALKKPPQGIDSYILLVGIPQGLPLFFPCFSLFFPLFFPACDIFLDTYRFFPWSPSRQRM
jgi:hypothetical protein